MSYDGKIMRRAVARLEEDKAFRARQSAERRARIFKEIPRLQEIETELRGTMSRIIAGALEKGTDPLPAIRVIRDRNLDLQRERSELLHGAGLEEDALEDKPNCPLCNDTGYRHGAVCDCLQRYYAREQIAELSQMLHMGTETFDTFSFDWYSDERGDYPRSPRENAEHNFDVCQDYARQFSPRSGNLLLSGAPGLGKTFLSACIARVVSESGYSVVYDTAARIFSRFENAKFRRGEEDESDEDVKRYLLCDLLILDDLGTEMTTSFVLSAFYQLIIQRLAAGHKTVISTNLKLDEIGRRYGLPALSRIEGEYEILPFIGEDIRRLKKER